MDCPKCGKSGFASDRGLKFHQTRYCVSKKVDSFSCVHCSKSYKTRLGLNRHQLVFCKTIGPSPDENTNFVKSDSLFSGSNVSEGAEIELSGFYTLRDVYFFRQICFGPVFPCVSCHRLLFRSSVFVISDLESYESKLDVAVRDCLFADNRFLVLENYYICKTCDKYLQRKMMPLLSIKNGLLLDEIPPELRLSELEHLLIAKNLLFLRVCFGPRVKKKIVHA